MKFESIDKIVKDILATSGDEEFKNYIPVARSIRRTAQQMNIFLLSAVKGIVVTIDENLTVPLSSDVDDILKAGTLLSNGRLRVMGRDDNFHSLIELKENGAPSACTCDPDLKEAVEKEIDDLAASISTEVGAVTCTACTFHNVLCDSLFGDSNGTLFGYRPEMFSNGRYKYDPIHNRIIFNGGADAKVGDKVVVEYKSNTASHEVALIPSVYYKCLRHKVLQEKAEVTRDLRMSAYHGQKFKDEYDIALRILSPSYTLEDYLGAFRGGYFNSPKA